MTASPYVVWADGVPMALPAAVVPNSGFLEARTVALGLLREGLAKEVAIEDKRVGSYVPIAQEEAES